MVSRERLAETFLELVRIDSPSRQERDIADYLESRLRELGCTVEEDQTARAINGNAGNLIARLPGEGRPVMLGAHMDTVEPGRRVRPRVRDGVVTSSGDTILGGDDKAGIAAILEAVRVIQAGGEARPPLEIVFTVAEEVGLLGAKHLDFGRLRSRMGFILDSEGPPGQIIVRGPSQDRLVAVVIGQAAHAGICPEEGVNAIQAAARGIAGLRLGRIDAETTANIGVIRGGQATNIVPDRVTIEGETRSLDDAKRAAMTEEIIEGLKSGVRQSGAEIQTEVETLYQSFRLSPDAPVVALARRAMERLGITPRLDQSGGGSDANVFNAAGIPTANLSCGMQRVHSTAEFLRLDDLVASARLVLEIIRLGAANGASGFTEA